MKQEPVPVVPKFFDSVNIEKHEKLHFCKV